MPKKLHLKRTPAEQAEQEWRKAHKAARKASRREHHSRGAWDDSLDAAESSDGGRARKRRYYGSDDDGNDAYGPLPPPRASTSRTWGAEDDAAVHAEVEEARFRDKMWSALGDDERLDAVEARLNDYAHVPRRWQRGGSGQAGAAIDEFEAVDPGQMDDEEYAEWVREGIWRCVSFRVCRLLGCVTHRWRSVSL
jgi:hypothetical protein